MKVLDAKQIADGSYERYDDNNSFLWHRFWAWIFGKRVPTSGYRAHIDNMLLVYRKDSSANLEIDKFQKPDGWATDANRIFVIGDLYIFDYGDNEVVTLESIGCGAEVKDRSFERMRHEALLKENQRQFRELGKPQIV